MKKLKHIGLFLLLIIIGLFTLYYFNYVNLKSNLEYVENSNLYKYYDQFSLKINGGNMYKKDFVEYVKSKDKKLYEILRDKYFNLSSESIGFFYGHQESENRISVYDFNFIKYIKGKYNITFNIDGIFFEDYLSNYVYIIDDEDSLQEYEQFDMKLIYSQYAKKKGCIRILPKAEPKYRPNLLVKVDNQRVYFIVNELQFSDETKQIISKVLLSYSDNNNLKNNFFIKLKINDIEDIICIDDY